MFIIGGLLIIKILQSRQPEIHAKAFIAFFSFAVLILITFIGIVRVPIYLSVCLPVCLSVHLSVNECNAQIHYYSMAKSGNMVKYYTSVQCIFTSHEQVKYCLKVQYTAIFHSWTWNDVFIIYLR